MGYIPSMTPGERAQWAILHEASAMKAGNVHPDAPFAEMSFDHFRRASFAIGNAIDANADEGLGASISGCVDAMMGEVGVNTSLGTILMLVPLSKLESRIAIGLWSCQQERSTITDTLLSSLEATDSDDCAKIYNAISKCNPGGLGQADRMDLSNTPPDSILDAMRFAATWDDVALQYSNGFEQVFRYANRLVTLAPTADLIPSAVRRLQGEVLVERMDSLIVRKHGAEVGKAVQSMAHIMMASGDYGSAAYESAWDELDRFMRDPQARKNPGTTADLIAAALYVASPAWN